MLDQIWTPGVYSENVLEEKISKQYFWVNPEGRVCMVVSTGQMGHEVPDGL